MGTLLVASVHTVFFVDIFSNSLMEGWGVDTEWSVSAIDAMKTSERKRVFIRIG